MYETDEILETYVRNTCKNTSYVEKHMQHRDETLANIRLENEMKHLEHILKTHMYSHCNMCNIPIYFCNIQMKHLQHSDGHGDVGRKHRSKHRDARTGRAAHVGVSGGRRPSVRRS
jgi:hypothetical protein